MEREGLLSAVYNGAGANYLRVGLALYSGCRLMQNRLRTLISGKVVF